MAPMCKRQKHKAASTLIEAYRRGDQAGGYVAGFK